MSNCIAAGHPTGWPAGLDIFLIVLGLLAAVVPLLTGVAVSLLFGWVILLGSAAHFTYAGFERGAGAVLC